MEWETGAVVVSTRGRDQGRKMCVVGKKRGYVLVGDGKERPLERPKRKNPKHLEHTALQLSVAQMRSNRAVKQALKGNPEA